MEADLTDEDEDEEKGSVDEQVVLLSELVLIQRPARRSRVLRCSLIESIKNSSPSSFESFSIKNVPYSYKPLI